MTAGTQHLRGERPLPAIPEVPYLIGVHSGGDGLVHAIGHDNATWAVENAVGGELFARASAVCGATVQIARYWGEFRRGNPQLDQLAGEVCPHCAWAVALDRGTTDAELALLTPAGPVLAAQRRLMPDPLLVVRICQRLLALRAAPDRQHDEDSPYWAQLLGHATAHRPVVLLPEACAESGRGCEEHDPENNAGCYAATDAVACGVCSVLSRADWAGEWSGQYECAVTAPCSVLQAMARQYGVEETPAAAPAAGGSRTAREVADAEHQEASAAALVAILQRRDGDAIGLLNGMYPYRQDELAQAARELMELAEGER